MEDIESYPDAAKFFRLVAQLWSYRGAIREEAQQQQAAAENKNSSYGKRTNAKRVTREGEQKALLLNNDAEMASVKQDKPSYLEEKLKQHR